MRTEMTVTDKHVVTLGHIILTRPVCILSLTLCCVISREAIHNNWIVFGLIQRGNEPTICRTRDNHDNHYTTSAVEM
jgi:hypothetical protein